METMKNLKRALIIVSLVVAVTLSTGCVEREITVDPYANGPALVQTETDIKIDANQAMDDCRDMLYDNEDFEYVDYLDMVVNEEKGYVELILPLTDDAPRSCAKDYAMAYIRAFNDACVTQDWQYKLSTPDYYGNYYEKHDLYILVFRSCDLFDHDAYYIAQHIPAGSFDELQYYEPTGTEEKFLENFGYYDAEE